MRALVYILEGTWWTSTEAPPVFAYLNALAGSHGLQIAHRTIRTADDIAHYVGRIPARSQAFLYIACHGEDGQLLPAGKRNGIPRESLLAGLEAAKTGALAFVHFGCCGMVDANNRRSSHQSVLEATDAHWASGYTEDVDWLQSTLLDLALIANVFQPFIGARRRMGPKITHNAARFIRDYEQVARSLGFSALHRGPRSSALFPRRLR